MIRRTLLVAALGIAFASSSWCGAATPSGNDPFERSWTISVGPNAGRKLSSTPRRSPVVLTSEERATFGIDASDGDLVFANFQHEGRFWIAIVPSESILATYYMLETFLGGPFAFRPVHASLVFETSATTPIRLVPQTTDEIGTHEVVTEQRYFSLSIEGNFPEGEGWNIVDAASGRYVAAGRVYGLGQHLSYGSGASPQQYAGIRLNLGRSDSWRLMNFVIERTASWEGGESFDLLLDNCHRKSMGLLREALRPHIETGYSPGWYVGLTLPSQALFALRALDVVNDDTVEFNVRESPIWDEAVATSALLREALREATLPLP